MFDENRAHTCVIEECEEKLRVLGAYIFHFKCNLASPEDLIRIRQLESRIAEAKRQQAAQQPESHTRVA